MFLRTFGLPLLAALGRVKKLESTSYYPRLRGDWGWRSVPSVLIRPDGLLAGYALYLGNFSGLGYAQSPAASASR